MTRPKTRLRRKSPNIIPSFPARPPNIPPHFSKEAFASKVPWEDRRWKTFHAGRAFNEVRDGDEKIVWPYEK
jgi:hypothetical protein